MLSVERTKELLSSLNLSDEESEHIRDISFMFAEIAYEAWFGDQKRIPNPKSEKTPTKNP